MACDPVLVESLLSTKCYKLTFGVLEYAAANSGENKVYYRNFLEKQTRFKNVLNIKNSEILEKIHITYRLSYLLDCILASYIEEIALLNLNKIHLIFQDEIITHVINTKEILSTLVKKFVLNIEDCLEFLEEIISMMKHFPLGEEDKIQFVHKLSEVDFFQTITKTTIDVISSEEAKPHLVIKLLGVITFMLQYRLSDFQDTLLLGEKNGWIGQSFLGALIQASLLDEEGVQIQVSEVIKQILGNVKDAKPALLDMIYDNFLAVLHKELINEFHKKENKLFLILQYTEILSQCCRIHTHRIRLFIIKNQIIQGLIPMLELNNRLVSIAIIKLFKNIIISKDDFLLRDLINKGLFDKLFDVFKSSSNTKNMVYSCFLDLFTSIYTEKVDSLIDYMLTKSDQFFSMPVMSSLSLRKKNTLNAKMSLGHIDFKHVYDEDDIEEDLDDGAEDLYEKRISLEGIYCLNQEDEEKRKTYDFFRNHADLDNSMLKREKNEENDKKCDDSPSKQHSLAWEIDLACEIDDEGIEKKPEAALKEDNNMQMSIENPFSLENSKVRKNRANKESNRELEKEEGWSTKRKKLKN